MSTEISGSGTETTELVINGRGTFECITSDYTNSEPSAKENEEGVENDGSSCGPQVTKHKASDAKPHTKKPEDFLGKDFEWDVQPPVFEYEDYLQVNDLGNRFVSRVCNEIEARINYSEHVDDEKCMSHCVLEMCGLEELNILSDSFIEKSTSLQGLRCSEFQKEKGIICSDDCICTVPVERDTDLSCPSQSCICQEPFKTICSVKECACVDCENLSTELEVGTITLPCDTRDCVNRCYEATTCKCATCTHASCWIPCNMIDCACQFCTADLVLVAPENECVCDKLLDSKHPCSCWMCPFESAIDLDAICFCFKEYDLFTARSLDFKTKPSLSLLTAVLKWPDIEHFTVKQMQRHVELFILMWDLNPAWMFCTHLASTIEQIGSTRYMFEVVFSLPTYKYPVPHATATVYFVVDISYILPPATPIDVHYRFEGRRCSYTPSPSVSFQEYILSSIIDSKIDVFRRLGIYNL